MNCPDCRAVIPEDRILKDVIYCSTCGWEPNARARNESRRQDRIMTIILSGVFAFFLLGALAYIVWKPFTLEAAPLWIKAQLRMADQTDLHELGRYCNTLHKSDCSIQVYERLSQLTPEDPSVLGNLAMQYADVSRMTEAIPLFERYFATGSGAVDAYYTYSKALFETGKKEEAVTAAYKALDINPRLVDVLQSQIQYLTSLNRPAEALSLLQGVIQQYPPAERYFKGEVISLSDRLKKNEIAVKALRIPAVNSHFFVPLRFNSNEFYSFVYDTGATRLLLNTKLVRALDLEKYYQGKTVLGITANGVQIEIKQLLIPHLWVGTIEVTDVEAGFCDECTNLMGQSLNTKFQSHVKQEKGTDFLTLER